MLIYLIVASEGLIALGATYWALRLPPGSPSRLVRGILSGMAICSFIHGLCFGILQVEGPHARDDPGLLVGFGLVAAVLGGLPLGLIFGLVLCLIPAKR